jgi:hypothetical protein
MKNMFFVMVAMICFSGCKDPVSKPEAEKLIAELARMNYIVEVDGTSVTVAGEIVAVIDVEQSHRAVSVCDPFGWGASYDWLCTLNGTDGRAIAVDAAEPSVSDVAIYWEAGSEEFPTGSTSTTYFNANQYALYLDTSANPHAFFGLTIAKFGPTWSPILEQWCTNDHIPMCVQD